MRFRLPLGALAVALSLGAQACGSASTPTQPSQQVTCSFSLSDTDRSRTAESTGGELTATVTTAAGCAWTAESHAEFLTITIGKTGTGAGTVRYIVAANTGAERSGTLTIAGQTVTVTQHAPEGCAFSVTPSSLAIPAAGGSMTVDVKQTKGTTCGWSATASDAFVQVSSGASGTGDGTVALTIAANHGGARSASLTVAGTTVTISQAAEGSSAPAPPAPTPTPTPTPSPTPSPSPTPAPGQCSFAVSPTSFDVSSAPTNVTVSVTVTQGSSCNWTAASNSAFLTITNNASGTGSGTVVIGVSGNASLPRTGTVTVAGITVTFTQAGPGSCATSISPLSQSFGPDGGSGFVDVTAPPTCAWTASTTAPFITLASASQTGSGRVTFTVSSNPSNPRSGSITIGILQMVITQSASAPVAVFSYRSDAGEYIGQGQSQTITTSNFSVTENGNSLNFRQLDPLGWSVAFAAPNGGSLAPGMYDGTARWPFQAAGQPGFDFSGQGRGCNTSTGRFVVAEAPFVNLQVHRFHAVFEQHCENSSAVLTGDLWIDSNGSTAVPALSLPAPPPTPTTFYSYVSSPGDLVGRGQSKTFTLASAVFAATASGSRIQAQLHTPGFSEFWILLFSPPTGQMLGPGTYNNTTRIPTATQPGLDVGSSFSGCNTSTGSFQVLELVLGPSQEVRRFHATFVQQCDGGPPLTGEIWIVADPWR